MITLYLVAAPLPKPRPSKGPPVLVADNLRLELAPVNSPWPVNHPRSIQVRTTLHNLADRPRHDLPIFKVLDHSEYHTRTDGIHMGVTLVVWFPDGSAGFLWVHGSGTKFEQIELAPLDSITAIKRGDKLDGFLDDDVVKKNNRRFCVIAVDGKRRLQSNTISYNGCPLPPSTFDPFRYCPGTPEGDAHYEKVSERRRLEAEPAVDLTTRDCITSPVERVNPPIP
jgi:hypothetical protein